MNNVIIKNITSPDAGFKWNICKKENNCYLGQLAGGEITLLEHEAAKWLGKDELYSVEWLPADVGIIPLVENVL